jgi:hypothetical protein
VVNKDEPLHSGSQHHQHQSVRPAAGEIVVLELNYTRAWRADNCVRQFELGKVVTGEPERREATKVGPEEVGDDGTKIVGREIEHLDSSTKCE